MDKSFEYFMSKKPQQTELPPGIDDEEELEDSDFDEEMFKFQTPAPPLTKEKLEEINRNWENEFVDDNDNVRNRESRVTFPPDDEIATVVLFKRESTSDTSHAWSTKSEMEFSMNICGERGSNFNIEQQILSSISNIKNIIPIEAKSELPVFDQTDLFQIDTDTSNDIQQDASSPLTSEEENENSIDFEPKTIHKILSKTNDIFNHNQNEQKPSESSQVVIKNKASPTKILHPFHGSCLNNTSLLKSYSQGQVRDISEFRIRRQPASAIQMQRVKTSENLACLNGNGMQVFEDFNPLQNQRPISTNIPAKPTFSKEELADDWIQFEEPEPTSQTNSEKKIGFQAQGEAVLFTQRKPPPMKRSISLESDMGKGSNDVLAEDHEMRAAIRGIFNQKTLKVLYKLPSSPKLIALAKDQIGRKQVSTQLLEFIFSSKVTQFLVEKNGQGFLGESKWATGNVGVRPMSAMIPPSFASSASLEKINLAIANSTGSGDKQCQKSVGTQKTLLGKKKSLGKKMKQNSVESEEPTSSSLSSKSPISEKRMDPDELIPRTREDKVSSKGKKPLKPKQKSKLTSGPNSNKKTDFESVFKYISKTSPRTPKGTTSEAIDRLLRATMHLEIKEKPKTAKKTQFTNAFYPERKPVTPTRPSTASAALTMDSEKWITRAIARTHKAEETLFKKIKADKNPRLMDAYKVYFNPKGNAVKLPARPATSPRF